MASGFRSHSAKLYKYKPLTYRHTRGESENTMRKTENGFIPSNTDIEKAKAHTRAIARKRRGQYHGYIECMFDSVSGTFHYHELVGDGSYISETDDYKHIYSATVYEF